MKMINTSNKKLYLIIAIVMIALITTTTIAWLSFGEEIEKIFKPGDFELQTVYTDSTDSSSITPEKGVYHFNGLSKIDYESVKGQVDLGYELPVHHLENIKIDLKVNAKIAGYLRVKVLDEWVVTRDYFNFDRITTEVVFKEYDEDENGNIVLHFDVAEGWVYDEKTKYYYYSELIEGGTTNLSIPFITGGISYSPKTSTTYYEVCVASVSSIAEMVQANRYEAIWGITEIPKEVSNG